MFRHRHRVVTSISLSSWTFFTSFSISVLLGFFFNFYFLLQTGISFTKNRRYKTSTGFQCFGKHGLLERQF